MRLVANGRSHQHIAPGRQPFQDKVAVLAGGSPLLGAFKVDIDKREGCPAFLDYATDRGLLGLQGAAE